MKTPREKYRHDPHYHALVDGMLNFIRQCKFTPSELREASILASIMYEEMTVRALPTVPEIPTTIIKALEIQHKWLDEISNIDKKGVP